MTIRTMLGLAQRLLAGVVLVVSGAYLLIYLYRWEWNRAIISGLFFLSAEVALASAMILRRLRALEHGMAAPPAEPSQAVFERLRSIPVERPNPFGWLNQRGQTQVFVPVLLGAGAILSAVAYVIERVAEATAVPALDRHLAGRLSTLARPSGGLVGGAPTAEREPQQPSRTMTITATLLALAAVGIVGWLGIGALVDATQSRPDVMDRPARTTIDLSIAQRSAPDQSAGATAEALWISCRPTLGSLATTGDIIPLGGDDVSLVLEPGIGSLGIRRLTGCLSDIKLDYVKADVLGVVSVPSVQADQQPAG